MLLWLTETTWAGARRLAERLSLRLFGPCMSCAHQHQSTRGRHETDRHLTAAAGGLVPMRAWHCPNSLNDLHSATVGHASILRDASSASCVCCFVLLNQYWGINVKSIQLESMYSQSHLGWHFRMLFQNSKLKARTSLFTENGQKRRSSFELWAFENVTPSGIGCTVPGFLNERAKGHHPSKKSQIFFGTCPK